MILQKLKNSSDKVTPIEYVINLSNFDGSMSRIDFKSISVTELQEKNTLVGITMRQWTKYLKI